MPLVTAIIPTLASSERESSLFRAINSLKNSISDISQLEILVVVNGNKYSADVLKRLNEEGINNLQLKKGSAPLASLAGVEKTSTDFFCFLDDDDEYLLGALDQRIERISEDNKTALVVTNGFRKTADHSQIIMSHLNEVEKDSLSTLFKENWLASCGGLFRLSEIDELVFQNPHPFLEWTWLAYKIALDDKKIVTLDTPTFIVNDTSQSLSKSESYMLSHIQLYKRMQQLNPPKKIADIIIKKRAHMLHTISGYYLQQGMLKKALQYHFKSLLTPYGLRYLSYSRKLLIR